jgi:hypothetical protein
MSIEAAIAANTAAIEANTAAVQALMEHYGKIVVQPTLVVESKARAAQTPEAAQPDTTAAPTGTKENASGKQGKAATPPPAASEAQPDSGASTASSDKPSESPDDGDMLEVVTLEELQATITAKAKTHRADVVAVLTSFGAKRGGEVKEADRAACNKKLLEIGA